ncbi:MFS transporter [Streptomyces sp. JJ38]|uniref:MFS transporter n=1 Tax=Streptomyces sp. JJ38 TaxID=2738128 RepID=UPI001C560EE0|nr:MFS transporter [Streptomyces sp. JJ38]MBW1599886.1 MFS transporter [Streptomyces sp. JJ38]
MTTSEASRRGAVATVLVGAFISALDVLIVNIAYPDLQESFPSASLTDLSWVLSAYAITFAALLIPAGRWADQFGRRRAYLIGLGLFTVASAGCAVAPSLGLLLAARVLQGVGGALMMPSSLGLLLPLFPAERRAAAIGLWTAVNGAGAALAPPIGGLLVQLDWRWVFLVNIPIGVVALLVGRRTLPELRAEGRSVPDAVGIAVLAGTVAAVVTAIVQGPSWGWGGARVLALLALGALGLAFTVWRAFRHPAPVIEPEVLRIRPVALGNLATLLFFGGFGALITTSTLFLTDVWDRSVLRAAMEFAPGPLAATLCAVPAGLLVARHGVRVVGVIGGALFATAGVWWTFVLDGGQHYLSGFLPGTIIGGAGIGLMMPCMSTAAMSLPADRFATGTAMTAMCRQIGIALGVAVVAAVLNSQPDVSDYHTGFLIMSACGLGGGLTLLAIRLPQRPDPARAPKSGAAAAGTRKNVA